jgi:hypothetical protein
VPFIGPYFDLSIGSSDTWHWTVNRLWLSVLPGAVAVLGGMLMILGRTRRSVSAGGLLALLAGLWFITGPSVSMLWENGALGTGVALGDTGTRVIEWLGYFYATGALITALAAYALGFMAALPIVDEPVAATAAGPDVAERRPPRRRRFLRRSRSEVDPADGRVNGSRDPEQVPADRSEQVPADRS